MALGSGIVPAVPLPHVDFSSPLLRGARVKPAVLVAFVDAFGADQLEAFSGRLEGMPHRRAIEGVVGYTCGALPTLLTGSSAAEHGRMCLFNRAAADSGPLAGLELLGLLPRVVHERQRVRRLVAQAASRLHGWSGYLELGRIPPEVFRWIDVPEQEDLFTARRIGEASTFLEDARQAGLAVYTAPWQLAEEDRWRHVEEHLRWHTPDLTMLYSPIVDGALHRGGLRALDDARLGRPFERIRQVRELLASRGRDVTTIVVGDHGMADVHAVIDPGDVAKQGVPVFIDSTMIRAFSDDAGLARVRAHGERQGWPGRWLEGQSLVDRGIPAGDRRFPTGMFLLEEGAIFAPSFVGGRVAGMHGYDLSARSALAGLASDRPLPEDCRSLRDVAALVRGALHLGTARHGSSTAHGQRAA